MGAIFVKCVRIFWEFVSFAVCDSFIKFFVHIQILMACGSQTVFICFFFSSWNKVSIAELEIIYTYDCTTKVSLKKTKYEQIWMNEYIKKKNWFENPKA